MVHCCYIKAVFGVYILLFFIVLIVSNQHNCCNKSTGHYTQLTLADAFKSSKGYLEHITVSYVSIFQRILDLFVRPKRFINANVYVYVMVKCQIVKDRVIHPLDHPMWHLLHYQIFGYPINKYVVHYSL